MKAEVGADSKKNNMKKNKKNPGKTPAHPYHPPVQNNIVIPNPTIADILQYSHRGNKCWEVEMDLNL